MKKIRTILRKEWAEVFKNKLVVFSVVFLPLLFAAIPLIMLGTMKGLSVSSASASEIPPQFAQICPEDLGGVECFQLYMMSSFMLMFMMTPLIVPVNIAAQSVVSEKTSRSLEPLLATPITTFELLAAKNLAASIPAVLATWVGFGIYVVGTVIIGVSPALVRALFDPLWLIAVFVDGPLMAILSVNFSLLVSSRVNDARAAEQISAVIVMPLLVLFLGQISGFLIINRLVVLLMALVLVLLDAAMLVLAIRLFQREAILTRWR